MCENHVIKAMIDNFGLDVDTTVVDAAHFQVNVTVCTSPTFYGWVFSWNGAMKILGPEPVKVEYREMLTQALAD